MNDAPPKSADFAALRRSGSWRGPGLVIGTATIKLRDALGAELIALGVTPNTITVAGCIMTGCAGVCLAVGAGHALPWEVHRASGPTSWWPLAGALLLTIACASDLLDGAVARGGNLATRFGAVLDSTLDRLSDLLIFFGCAIHFSLAGNVTYVTLCVMAAANAVLISYVKARTEDLIGDCGVGYWQRGERCGLFLAAAYFGHIPAALWLLATLPMLTVIRRLRHAYDYVTEHGPWEPGSRVRHWMPWRHPRGSAGYDLCGGLLLAFVVAAPLLWPFFYGGSDPLRSLLGGLTGA